MSTFIINLNDTTVVNDSVFAKVVKLSEVYQPVVTEAETNCNDVMIVAIICVAMILLSIIAAIVISLWHYKDMKIRMVQETEKIKNDMEMIQYEALRKDTEERNRLARHFQKIIFDKIIAKKIEREDITKEGELKNLCKIITDFINNIINIKV